MTKNDYSEIIEKTLCELKKGEEWEDIYSKYAGEIMKRKSNYVKNINSIKHFIDLPMYSSIAKLKDTSVRSDLRYGGQSIGEIKISKCGITQIKIKENIIADNKEISKDKWYSWDSDEAKSIRKYYTKKNKSKKINEHYVESRMLAEFSKKSRKEKALPNVRPVRLGNLFFQFTTPLQASKKRPKIALTSNKNGANGGGIDILARIKTKEYSNSFNLAVIEIKDENKSSESQKDVMSQAIIYATFIASLLRSKSGKDWWKLFRESKKNSDVPKKIEIYVVTLMPKGNSEEGYLGKLEIEELGAALNLHSLYYTFNSDNSINFCGTLPEVLKP